MKRPMLTSADKQPSDEQDRHNRAGEDADPRIPRLPPHQIRLGRIDRKRERRQPVRRQVHVKKCGRRLPNTMRPSSTAATMVAKLSSRRVIPVQSADFDRHQREVVEKVARAAELLNGLFHM